jgi:hypothetical protein
MLKLSEGINSREQYYQIMFYFYDVAYHVFIYLFVAYFPQISLGKSSQVKANEVGGACGTHGRGEKSVQGFGGKARRKETTGKTKA